MKVEVLPSEADPFIEDLKKGNCHLVSIGAIGLTNFSAYCEFGCGIKQDEQAKYVKQVDKKHETGTIYPKANVTILPHPHNPIYNITSEKIKANLRDAFIAERDFVKSKFMVFDYRSCLITQLEENLYNHFVKQLLSDEFRGVEGTVYIYRSGFGISEEAFWNLEKELIDVFYTDLKADWRHKGQKYGVTPEMLLNRICVDGKQGAETVLNWADEDLISASTFMAGFLAKIFRELDVRSAYLDSKSIFTSFNDGFFRPSISEAEFRDFCQLLHKNPQLINLFRDSPLYPRGIRVDLIFFGSPETRARIQQEEKVARRLEYESERKSIEENRERKKQERLAVVQPKVERRKQESVQRKVERIEFQQKPLIEQVRHLALDESSPVKAFPIDPNTITSEILEKLDDDCLNKLSERISNQRPKSWKNLILRINSFLERNR